MKKLAVEFIFISISLSLVFSCMRQIIQFTSLIDQLTKALRYWQLYTETAMEQNINPIWTHRVGYVDWVKTTKWVEYDIEIAKADL